MTVGAIRMPYSVREITKRVHRSSAGNSSRVRKVNVLRNVFDARPKFFMVSELSAQCCVTCFARPTSVLRKVFARFTTTEIALPSKLRAAVCLPSATMHRCEHGVCLISEEPS